VATPALDTDVEGYRMPAEWEPHEATWLGWPHNVSDWPGRFAPIPWVYGEIVRKVADGTMVHYLDIGHEFIERDGTISKSIMPDALHLSPEGYAIWARSIEPALAPLLR